MSKESPRIRCPHCSAGTMFCPNAGKPLKEGFFKRNTGKRKIVTAIITALLIIASFTVYKYLGGKSAPSFDREQQLPVKKQEPESVKSDGEKHNERPLQIESDFKESLTGMEFVWVPDGCFMIGQSDMERDELLQEIGEERYKKYYADAWGREVCVDGFWMGKYEVTNIQFVQFLNEVKTRGTEEKPWFQKKNETYSRSRIMGETGDFEVEPGYEKYPVIEVSWHGAKAFARWLSDKTGLRFRLPTETEWEYGCRSGGRPEKYCGGNDVNRVAWYHSNSGETPHPVGTKAPNELGLYDMSGNVWEWCEDIYLMDAYSRYSSDKNPVTYVGESDDWASRNIRVQRGGSWKYGARRCLSATRDKSTPEKRVDDVGFRVVRGL